MRRALPLLLFALPAGDAAAQERPAADTTGARRLDTVVVRALRGAAADGPWAVTVRERPAHDRARAGLSLDEPLRALPGVQVDNRHNYALGERISVRGAGARAQFGVRGVRVLVDGVPATLPDGQTTLNHVDPSLVRRVEAVRGAASALHGNAAGGVLYLETLVPTPGPVRADAQLVAGSHALRRLRAGAGGGAERTAWALHLSGLESEGHRAHAEASSRWAVARVAHQLGRGALDATATVVRYDARNPGSLSDSLLGVDRTMAFRSNVQQNTGETGTQAQLGARARLAVAGLDLELAPHLLTRTIDNPIPGRVIDLDRVAGGVRLLARAPERGVRRLWWAAGAEAEAQDDDRRNHANRDGARGALLLDQRERVGTAALFAQGGASPLDRLALSAGLRHDRIRFRADDRLVSATDPDDSGERVMRATSPSVGAALRLARAATLFANVSTAFETPTTTELANRPEGAGGFNPALAPQRAISAEIGARGGERLRWEASLWRSDVRDALIPFEVAGAPGRQFFRNAGRVANRGAELALRAELPNALRAEGALTWTDARFDRFAVGGVDYEGNRVPGVAPVRGELALTWAPPRRGFVTVEGRAAGRTPANDANTAHAPSFASLDLRAGTPALRFARHEVALHAGVANLTGAEYDASVVVNAFGARYHEPAPGRTLFVGLTVSP